MTYDTAIKLADELKKSEEFASYKDAYEMIKDDETTTALLKDYHKLQVEAQSMMYTGKKDEEILERLRKVGELLNMNADATAFLMAEYRLNTVVGDIYKIIAEAVNIDLGMLEA